MLKKTIRTVLLQVSVSDVAASDVNCVKKLDSKVYGIRSICNVLMSCTEL